ncbi:benzylsuccinate synthase gamma subunit family protein [bacterium]|nr:benzylsuccinate synthase gamma subunit family protein [bacterium]
MAECNECKHFFPLEEDKSKGDCVRRQTDERQAYFFSKPVDTAVTAASCTSFMEEAT